MVVGRLRIEQGTMFQVFGYGGGPVNRNRTQGPLSEAEQEQIRLLDLQYEVVGGIVSILNAMRVSARNSIDAKPFLPERWEDGQIERDNIDNITRYLFDNRTMVIDTVRDVLRACAPGVDADPTEIDPDKKINRARTMSLYQHSSGLVQATAVIEKSGSPAPLYVSLWRKEGPKEGIMKVIDGNITHEYTVRLFIPDPENASDKEHYVMLTFQVPYGMHNRFDGKDHYALDAAAVHVDRYEFYGEPLAYALGHYLSPTYNPAYNRPQYISVANGAQRITQRVGMACGEAVNIITPVVDEDDPVLYSRRPTIRMGTAATIQDLIKAEILNSQPQTP